jgi:hypothetical protein
LPILLPEEVASEEAIGTITRGFVYRAELGEGVFRT